MSPSAAAADLTFDLINLQKF